MHFQTTVTNWPLALLKMPDYTLLKAVNDPGLLLDGYIKWTAAGRDPDKLFLDHRYHDFYYPEWEGADQNNSFEEFRHIWRENFKKTIDATYYRDYAPYINLIEELNEYTDTRMITDKALLAPRIRSARAAVEVWNNEYRGKNGIPDDARLVVCNSPVGNDIPIEYFQLCRDEDAVMGVRNYTHWVDKKRDPGDFRWHSGRPFANEAEYGIKVDYVMGETGPYNGSTSGGWRVGSCMGGDRNLLVQGMRDWWLDLATTNAYQEGRILGPGAWFTCNRSDAGQWKHFLLWETELMLLAEECAKVWKPGTYNPPPPPDPEPEPPPEPPSNGVPYVVKVELLDQEATIEDKHHVIEFTHDDKRTITQSADDAVRLTESGKEGSRVNVWGVDRWEDNIVQWLLDRGAPEVVALEYPKEETDHQIIDVVDLLPKHETKTYKSREIDNITTLVIHHTVSPCNRATSSIAGYHVNSRDWPGIGYHYVIGCDGKIELTNYLDTISYHAGVSGYDNNEVSIGIALKDNFTDRAPTQEALAAARWLVQELMNQLGPLEVKRHRDMPGAQTACPGATSPDWMGYISGGES